MGRPLRVLDESEAKLGSFHDCHVHGLRWRRDQFTFSMDLQYILEWIEPSDGTSSYRFAVSEARLTFRDVDAVKVSMDWTGAAPDAQIASIQVLKERPTPNGLLIERYFEIEFSDPDAIISLWSTGYEVILLHEPVITSLQSIRLSDEQ